MSCWGLDYTSSYFRNLSISTDTDRQAVNLLIASAVEFVERVCNRHFKEAEYDKVFTVLQDGSVLLANPPISAISRLCAFSLVWATIANTSGSIPIANYSTTESGLQLIHYAAGVKVKATLAYSDYPTLGQLATAVAALGNGWSMSITSGKTDYPSTDLIAMQVGNAKGGGNLSAWEDYTGTFANMIYGPTAGIAFDRGISYDTSYSLEPQAGFLRGFIRGSKVRAIYTGGWSDPPEPIKQVVASLVTSAFNGPEGRIKSETLGSYSYSLEDASKLPASDQRVLAYYKDRQI